MIKEIHSQWYSLGIELDIDHETRKVRPLIPSLMLLILYLIIINYTLHEL